MDKLPANIQTGFDNLKKHIIDVAHESLQLWNSCFDANNPEHDQQNCNALVAEIQKDPQIDAVWKALCAMDL